MKAAHKDDPAQQQEMMALYQGEDQPDDGLSAHARPDPGLLLAVQGADVTIEMRHAPFFGWIRDLSDRDPTNIWNLFGLIPWDPATAPLIGTFLSPHLGGGFTSASGRCCTASPCG
jgi:YidC/Oxa1 family membrane protein insertase